MRPVLLIDVDGPLNPYAAKPHRRPEGYETHRLMTPRWQESERERLVTSGQPNKRVRALRVWLNPAHGEALAGLGFDLVWATTWEEEANEFIAPLVGLPPLSFITWPVPRLQPGGGLFWKTPAVVSWMQPGRPFAWIDDEFGSADEAFVAEHHEAPSLLHWVDPVYGLTDADFDVLRRWAESVT